MITGIDVPIDHKQLRPQEISEFIADHTNQNAMVNYQETPFYEALRKTWEWTKEQELTPVVNYEKELNVHP